MSRKLEIACFNLQSAVIADISGADRIELCENYSVGGITPSFELLEEVLKIVSIPVFVMIRPREGNFIYNKNELELMKEQIEFCKTTKCSGLVFGILTEENKINASVCKELVELAKPLPCTFHRAFDDCSNMDEALEEIINCGFTRILTSGGAKSALEGIKNLVHLTSKASNRIIIVPGGGIRANNLESLVNITKTSEYHTAALIHGTDSADANLIQKMKRLLST